MSEGHRTNRNGGAPADWQTVSIGDAFEMQLGKMLSKAAKTGRNSKRYLANRNVQWDRVDISDLETMDFTESEQEKFSLLPGDLLVCEGGEVGRTSLWRGEAQDCYFQKAIHRLRPRSFRILPEYMLRLMRHLAANGSFTIFTSQSSIAHLTREKLAVVPVSFPPLPQQRKIARILTTLDNLIEKTEALIAKYQSIKQGMMADLFTRGVDANGKLRPPQSAAPELYKQSELGWIPIEWNTQTVIELGSVKLGRQRSPDQHSGRYTTPYLRVANVFDGWIDYSDVLEMDFTPTERETFSVLPNDILLNEGQSLELVGRSAMYLSESHRYCFQNTLVRFRCTSENHPAFWQDCFQYGRSIGRFMQIASQTTSVAHLGADRFARMVVVRPPFEEQVEIAKRIRSMNRRMQVEQEQRIKLQTLKTGLMQDLLTGKVPVKPDEMQEIIP